MREAALEVGETRYAKIAAYQSRQMGKDNPIIETSGATKIIEGFRLSMFDSCLKTAWLNISER